MFLSVILLRKQFKTDADILCLYFQDQMSSTAHRIPVPLVVRLQQVQVMPHLPLLPDPCMQEGLIVPRLSVMWLQ